ncbi:MAG: hypothetical protein SPG45_05295 [Lactobacillus johnsonii]|nr:hypothetical protein [Lactobacillus johnsonii]MDY5419450.1 hypothetical protein [Lactobacillus johnsonii]
MKDLKASDKLCFVNFIFKNGCTDSVAVAKSKEHLWNNFTKKLDEYGKGIKNDVLTYMGDGIWDLKPYKAAKSEDDDNPW